MGECVYHVCTGENHPDVFLQDSDYKTAVNIMAMCISLFDGLELLAFSFMSNHIHLLLSGLQEDMVSFFKMFVKTLNKYFKCEGIERDFSRLSASYHQVNDLNYLQNVIVYIHRNASVVNMDVSPYSYRWSSGRYYFNPEARLRYNSCRKSLSLDFRQRCTHSRKFDGINTLYEVDNYVSPFCFCAVEKGERLFRSSNQYMHMLCKNVESSCSIAREIGERIVFSDMDLYPVVRKFADKMFSSGDLAQLSAEQKIIIAKKLHYDYNSNNKQISRLIKIDPSVVNELFPQSAVTHKREKWPESR